MFGTALTRRSSNDLFSDFVDHFFDRSLVRSGEENGGSRTWIPAVDLSQSDDSYRVVVDLPGLKRDDIELTVENDTLTLSGERTFESKENQENYSRVERAYGRFSRSFSLPSNIDSEKVDAKFADGVLTVTLPKLEQAKTRQIAIK